MSIVNMTYFNNLVNIKKGIKPTPLTVATKSTKRTVPLMCTSNESTGGAPRKGPHWKYIDELEKLWLDNDMPLLKQFETLAEENGYPYWDYKGMLTFLRKKYKYKVTMKKGQPRKGEHWARYDELYSIWVENDYPSYVAFNKIVVDLGFPNVNYSGMLKAFDREQDI